VPDAPKHYTLLPGADAARGAKIFADRCAGCHGGDGRGISLDGSSAGVYARELGYEVWLKILNGQPGTGMHREIMFTSGKDAAQTILDLPAAMCDREAFLAPGGGKDVADGDLRCGAYLR